MDDTRVGTKVAQRGARTATTTATVRPLTEQLTDPQSPAVLEALTRACDQCRAPAGQLCTKRGGITRDLLGRVIHLGRMCDA